VPATFFVTTAQPGGEYWWDALERCLLDEGDRPSTLEVPLGDTTFRLPTSSAEERRAAHATLHPHLVHASSPVRDTAMSSVIRWGGDGLVRYRSMSAEQICRLARIPGMSIGVHTVSHLALPDQPADVQLEELVACRERLSALIDRPVTCMAYPYGAVDRDVARLVRRQFQWGLSCDEAAVPDSFDAARVPRVEVKAWPVEQLAARLLDVSLPGALTPMR
jgi:peptidoglycan/xylan/chitin deacetylase (PgdA/CDA1 family)